MGTHSKGPMNIKPVWISLSIWSCLGCQSLHSVGLFYINGDRQDPNREAMIFCLCSAAMPLGICPKLHSINLQLHKGWGISYLPSCFIQSKLTSFTNLPPVSFTNLPPFSSKSKPTKPVKKTQPPAASHTPCAKAAPWDGELQETDCLRAPSSLEWKRIHNPSSSLHQISTRCPWKHTIV